MFLLLCTPVGFVAALSWHNRLGDSAVYRAFILGSIWYIPIFVVYLLLADSFPLSYRALAMYVSFGVERFLLHHLWVVGGVLLLTKVMPQTSRQYGALTFLAFACGYMSLVNLYDLVTLYPLYTAQSLFLVPLYRLCIIFCTSMLLDRIMVSTGMRLVAGIAAAVVIPLLVSTGAFFYQINRFVISVLLGVTFSAAAVVFPLFLWSLFPNAPSKDAASARV